MKKKKKKDQRIKLNLGCGVHLLDGFVNVDNEFTMRQLKSKKGTFINAVVPKNAKFVRSDIRKLPFKSNYADYILLSYVIEHLSMKDIVPAIKEWLRVLKPGGYIYITTHNFNDLARMWTNIMENYGNQMKRKKDWNMFVTIAQNIYGNQVSEGEHHRSPFNVNIMNHWMDAAKVPYWKLAHYPPGHKIVYPEGYEVFKGKPGKKYGYVFGEIHVKAYKKVPKGVKKSKK